MSDQSWDWNPTDIDVDFQDNYWDEESNNEPIEEWVEDPLEDPEQAERWGEDDRIVVGSDGEEELPWGDGPVELLEHSQEALARFQNRAHKRANHSLKKIKNWQ